jgi:hypothetical protein
MVLMQARLLLFTLILIGCESTKPARPGSRLLDSHQSNLAPRRSPGLPTVTAMKGTEALSPPDDPGKFTFVVFGDHRPAKGEPQPETIKEIFTEINELHPAFAISLGDIIEGKPKSDDPHAMRRVRQQFKDVLALAVTAGVPIFNAPGNHQMDDEEDIPTERMHELYRECVGPTYGAFDHGNSRFVILNTEDVPAAGTTRPPKDEEFSFISPEQLAQLEADLEANRGKAHVFIAMHYPIHGRYEGPPESAWDDRLHPQSRKALVEMFEGFDNIAYVMAAHEHLYFNPQSPEDVTNVPGWNVGDPTVYLVSGGAGAPLNDGKWGFHHYLVFSVDGDEVTVRLVKLEGKGSSS